MAQILEEACKEAEIYRKAGIVRVNVSLVIHAWFVHTGDLFTYCSLISTFGMHWVNGMYAPWPSALFI